MAPEVWTVKLLLMSCRVMSKGVVMIMLHHILRQAKKAGIKLRAEFVSNNRNRQKRFHPFPRASASGQQERGARHLFGPENDCSLSSARRLATITTGHPTSLCRFSHPLSCLWDIAHGIDANAVRQ